MKRIETKKGLQTLLERMEKAKKYEIDDVLPEYEYWYTCVKQCLESQDTNEPIYMDETDFENAPSWFRLLWRGLK